MRAEVTGGALRIELSRAEQMLGLRRSFAVPLGQVRSARVEPRREVQHRRGLRAPGTEVPGRIAIGTWRGHGRRDFWNVRRADRVLVVELEGNRFDRLVLEVDDPDRLAGLLGESAPDIAILTTP